MAMQEKARDIREMIQICVGRDMACYDFEKLERMGVAPRDIPDTEKVLKEMEQFLATVETNQAVVEYEEKTGFSIGNSHYHYEYYPYFVLENEDAEKLKIAWGREYEWEYCQAWGKSKLSTLSKGLGTETRGGRLSPIDIKVRTHDGVKTFTATINIVGVEEGWKIVKCGGYAKQERGKKKSRAKIRGIV